MSEAYNAATAIYYYWGLFFKSVADNLGLEKAYELHEDSVVPIGSTYEAMVNEQYPDGLDLKAFGEFTYYNINLFDIDLLDIPIDSIERREFQSIVVELYAKYKIAEKAEEGKAVQLIRWNNVYKKMPFETVVKEQWSIVL